MDVEAWLKGLGLERYAERFAASEITWQVVPQLTDADLRELGLPLGPRKILLAAIATLRHDPTPGGRGDERPTGASAPDAVPGHEVERRHLTVMFVDLAAEEADPCRDRLRVRDPQLMSLRALVPMKVVKTVLGAEVLRWTLLAGELAQAVAEAAHQWLGIATSGPRADRLGVGAAAVTVLDGRR